MAFNYVGSVNGAQRNLVLVLLADSLTFSVGEIVETYTTGYAVNALAAKPFLGVIHAITTEGSLPEIKGASTAGSANTSDTKTVTTAADNVSTKKYYALVDTSVHAIYSCPSNGTIGTTADSELPGARVDVDADEGQILENTATRTIGTPANFYIHGLDPNDAARSLVSIAMSEYTSVGE